MKPSVTSTAMKTSGRNKLFAPRKQAIEQIIRRVAIKLFRRSRSKVTTEGSGRGAGRKEGRQEARAGTRAGAWKGGGKGILVPGRRAGVMNCYSKQKREWLF